MPPGRVETARHSQFAQPTGSLYRRLRGAYFESSLPSADCRLTVLIYGLPYAVSPYTLVEHSKIMKQRTNNFFTKQCLVEFGGKALRFTTEHINLSKHKFVRFLYPLCIRNLLLPEP